MLNIGNQSGLSVQFKMKPNTFMPLEGLAFKHNGKFRYNNHYPSGLPNSTCKSTKREVLQNEILTYDLEVCGGPFWGTCYHIQYCLMVVNKQVGN